MRKKDMTRSQRQRSKEIARACLQAWVNANPGIIECREYYIDLTISVGWLGDNHSTAWRDVPHPAYVDGLSMSKAPSYWREKIKNLVEAAYAEARNNARYWDRAKLPELVYPY